MPATAAQLVVDVTANTAPAEKGLDAVNKKVTDAPALFGGATKGILAMVGATVGIGTIAVGALALFTKWASDSDVVIAETNQLLKSTHGVSGQTAQSINDLTNRLKDLTGVDDDVVRTAANVLLTFTNIGKDAFPKATSAALDLATFLNKGLLPSQDQVQSSAILIGKALNDPIKGMTALQRVGITLSDTQKQQIKSFMAVGDVADAQRVILGELNKETGGLAESAGNTLPGMLSKLKNTFQDVGKAVGFIVLPVLQGLLTIVLALVQPLADGLGGALDGVKGSLSALGDALKPLQAPWQALQEGAKTLWTIFADNLKPAFDDIGKTLGSLFNPNIKGAADGLQNFITNGVKQAAPYVKLFADKLSDLIRNGLDKLKDFFHSDTVRNLQAFSDNLRDQVGPAVKQLGDWFQNSLLPALRDVQPKFDDLANTFVTVIVPAILDLNDRLMELKVWLAVHILPILEQIIPPLVQFAGVIAQGISDAIKNVGPRLKEFGDRFKDAKDKLSPLQPVMAAIGNYIQTVLIPWFKQLGDWIRTQLIPTLKDLATWFHDHVLPVLKDLGDKIKEASPYVKQFATDVSTRLLPIIKTITDFMQKHVVPALKGFANWISEHIIPVLKQLQTWWDAHWPAMQATFTKVWGVIQGVITIAWSIVSGIIKVGLDILGGNWKQAWTDIKDAFAGVWRGIQQIAHTLFGAIKEWIVNKIEELKLKAWAKFVELKANVTHTIQELHDNIVNTLQSLPGKLYTLGQQMIQNIIDGINSIAGNLTNKIHDIIHNAFSNLPGGLHIPGFALGGVASGGLAVVGERGPEVVALPAGARVYSAAESRAMASSLGGSGGGSSTVILEIDGRQLARALLPHTVGEIRRKTGLKLN